MLKQTYWDGTIGFYKGSRQRRNPLQKYEQPLMRSGQ